MRATESVVVPAPPDVVFGCVSSLSTYPEWLRLVHDVEPDGADAWVVELRAQVGPFARSKRLRMARTHCDSPRSVAFERDERDGREHARWALRVELQPIGDDQTTVTMQLAYDGRLWTGGLLQRAFDDEVQRGREGLLRLVSDAPTR